MSERKKYQAIIADPPWSYKDKKLNRGGALRYYSTLSLEEIKRINVADYAAEDSLLFMWATSPLLKEALAVMEAWGFTYKTIAFAWVKRSGNHWENLSKVLRHDIHEYGYLMQDIPCFGLNTLSNWFGSEWLRERAENKFDIGMGSYTRANCELVLLGTKGKATSLIQSHAVRQVIDSPTMAHSKKPDEFYKKVNQLVGNDISKLELFARCNRDGWDSLGNELTNATYSLNDEFQIRVI